MNKFSAYAGYALASTLEFVRKRFFKLAFLGIALMAVSDLGTMVRYTSAIGQRFYDFTSWAVDYAAAHGPADIQRQ